MSLAADAVVRRLPPRFRLAVNGFEPVGGTPRQFADYQKTELVKWALVVRETGASAE